MKIVFATKRHVFNKKYQFWGFAPVLELESYALLVYSLNLMSMNSGHYIAIEMKIVRYKETCL